MKWLRALTVFLGLRREAVRKPLAPPLEPLTAQPSAIAQELPSAPPGLVRAGVPTEAFELSKVLEGYKLVPYDDNGDQSGGTWTIGYGSTLDRNGAPVTRSTPPITEAEARQLKCRDFAQAEKNLRADFPEGLPARWWAVGLLLNNNLGRMSVYGPTLFGHLRAGRYEEAAHFMRHFHNQRSALGTLVPVLGLRRRRWCEAAYALGMPPTEAYRRAWSEIHSVNDWPRLPLTGISSAS